MQPILVAHQHQYWRLFTVMFLHADLLHIFFNMYALYLFGYLIENALGRARFIALYFVSGFVASAASYTLSPPGVVAVLRPSLALAIARDTVRVSPHVRAE